ncbi:MAG: ROK family protein [Aerococcus sp.]|nr:ROK family protein [Aerococcus sp.]
MYGAIEAGGTKFVCAVSDDNFNIVDRVSFPTTKPAETMMQTIQFFQKYDVKAIGVGSFGPIDVNPASETYGYITSTPKDGWRDYDFLGVLKEDIDVPMYWTTDVNAAAYGEYQVGAAKACQSCLYLTVGTGVGGGYVNDGTILEGFTHPEMGHILLTKAPDDPTPGCCPFHNDRCLEGLASGTAITARTGKKGVELDSDDQNWDHVADYLAQACMTFTLTLSPEKIILGGGVMKQPQLLPKIKEKLMAYMNGYSTMPAIESYIETPGLGDNAGVTGALYLAKVALDESEH